uniref:RNase H type-1 domain-containing protein n=1 Tax=Chenopodium quinoa TaxID=63459 RepID=A0A803M8H5_CHEQI
MSVTWRVTFSVALWHLWKAWNYAVFQQAIYHPLTLFYKYKMDLDATLSILQGKGKIPALLIRETRWQRPKGACIKMNTDGAWRKNGRIAGAGAVARLADGT